MPCSGAGLVGFVEDQGEGRQALGPQRVCLSPPVRGQHDGAAGLGLLDDVPHVAAADGVLRGCS